MQYIRRRSSAVAPAFILGMRRKFRPPRRGARFSLSFTGPTRTAPPTVPGSMLITFEGIDGSGKSTQARLLVGYFERQGQKPLLVREPGGTELSERIRALLLDPAAHISPRAELLLFSAARAQLVAEAVRPALAAGRVVIADRFYDSTTAYQGAGRGLAEADWLRDFHAFVTDGLAPDRTYYIDVPLETAATRRGGDRDRMEESGNAFFERVRAAYRRLADAESERVAVLDGRRSVEALHAEIVHDVEALLAAEPQAAEPQAAADGTGRPPSGSPPEDS